MAHHYRKICALVCVLFAIAAVLALVRDRPWSALWDLVVAALWCALIWVPWRPGGSSRSRYDGWVDRHATDDR